MNILTGLFDNAVLQRGKTNTSAATFTGSAAADGTLQMRVTKSGRVVKNFDRVKVGAVKNKKFEATLKGLAAGGPYDIALAVVDRKGQTLDEVTVRNVGVGDVWILGGQSNMQGCGLLRHAAAANPMVRAFYMDDRWDVAKDPIHNMHAAVDGVHTALNGGNPHSPATIQGTGPGVAFGQEMARLTGVPQGLIACAHGGTSMEQWDPAKKKLGGAGSLYGATIRRFEKNGGSVAGVVWYQGESDATEDLCKVYSARMKKLIASFRRDFDAPAMPFVLVQIGRFVCQGDGRGWDIMRNLQRLLQDEIEQVATVPAIDLQLDDAIHVGGEDMNRLGRRLARAAYALTPAGKKTKPPIQLDDVKLESNRLSGNADIIVSFRNVEGALQSKDRPVGFDVVETGGPPCVYGIDLEGNKAILHLTVPLASIATRQLYYGRGFDPACNITDAADCGVPTFGPFPIGKMRALTGFTTKMHTSGFHPSAEKLHALRYPDEQSGVTFNPTEFPTAFSSVRDRIAARQGEDLVVFFRCHLNCKESMKLVALLGYDGPLKVWIDGTEIYHDPDGINPALMDAKSVPFAVAAGRHEVLIALGTNSGAAWGVFLRFERVDLTKRQLEGGPSVYAMPEIE